MKNMPFLYPGLGFTDQKHGQKPVRMVTVLRSVNFAIDSNDQIKSGLDVENDRSISKNSHESGQRTDPFLDLSLSAWSWVKVDGPSRMVDVDKTGWSKRLKADGHESNWTSKRTK